MNFILSKLSNSIKKGALLEEVVEDILHDLSLSNIRRQKSGAQYGYDLVAIKKGKWDEVWKFECKNLCDTISINDVAPKLIWHIGHEIVDRFIIVSVTAPNTYLRELFDKVKFPFPVEIWSGDYMAQQILKSQRASKRLEIKENIKLPGEAVPIIYEQSLISFDAFCSEKLPYSFDYFNSERGLTKAYTEEWINLVAVFCNNSKHHTFVCTEINVLTLHYSKITGRVFRQAKQKGIVKPVKLSFSPSPIPSQSLPILPLDQIMEVKANKDEFIMLELQKDKVSPGYYELIFEAKGRFDKKDMTLYSTVFSLHIAEPDADIIRLNTVGKFYDTAVETILDLDQKKWEEIKTLQKIVWHI